MLRKSLRDKLSSLNILHKNVFANFTGTIWQTLMAMLFIPLYIKFMGIESWGLIGIFASLQIILGLLDMGLSSTLNREMARLSVIPNKEDEMRNLVRTLEFFYWSVAILIGIVIIVLSPVITNHWIDTGGLSPKTVQQALLIMGFVMTLQMPIGFYSGGLMGLQKQVHLNVINIIMSTFRGGGAVFVLWLISPTVHAYFIWQIIISSFTVFLLGHTLWKKLPYSDNHAVFQKHLLRGIWKFAAGMSGITILAVILTQVDKIVLSKMLSLEMFGYYTLASTVAMSLTRLTTPIMTAIYPKLTQMISNDDQNGLKLLYHKSCQLVAVLVLPVAVIISLFSYDILMIWTQNSTTALRTYILVSILTAGTGLYGLMVLPYTLQLASGWTSLSIYKNIIAVILLVPAIIVLTHHYGAIGASIAWFVLNLGYVLFEIPMVHKRLLRHEKWRWYINDVFYPLGASVLIAGLGKLLISGISSPFVKIIYIGIVFIFTLAVTAFTTQETRRWMLNHLRFK